MPLLGYIIPTTAVIACYAAYRKYVIAGTACSSQKRLYGKTVIITGCNTGIGKETARALAKRGARVILACRDVQKAQAAKEEIAMEIGTPYSLVVHHLDLASLTSVRRFAKKILQTEDRLDILINNAGVGWTPRQLTEDGFEMQLGVNHLGHFLLTNLLLDLLKSSAPSRVVNVASRAHRTCLGSMRFDDLMGEKSYNRVTAYGQSKLANILFTKELARRLDGTGVDTYCLHPGVINTEIARYIGLVQLPVIKSVVKVLGMLILKTPEQGAQTTLHCALAEELEGISGKYYSDCQVAQPTKAGQNAGDARRLWDVSAELVGLENT